MLRWVLVAIVVALGCVRADEAAATAAEASVVAAVAADAPSLVEANAHVSGGADASATAVAEAETDKRKKDKHNKHKKDHKKKHHKHKRRYVGGDILFNRAMNVRGVMAAGSIIANNATVEGTLIARKLKTKHVKAHTLSVGELKTTRLSSPTGTIVIEGDLLITHSRGLEYAPKPKAPKNKQKTHKGKGKQKPTPAAASGPGAGAPAGVAPPSSASSPSSAGTLSLTAPPPASNTPTPATAAKGMSFLAEEVVVRGVKQWALVRHDHFQTPESIDGWRLVGTNEALPTGSCGAGSGDTFLGGHCQLANGPAHKVYTHLPPHTHLRVTARYHFIDHWSGETAFAKIDSRNVWAQTHRASATAVADGTGIDMCGSEKYAESRLSSPIDVSVAHTASTVSIAFGAHSAASASGAVRSLADEQQNACERSFGVDDVAIYVR